MTIRLIVRTDDANMASHVGGSVETTFRSFDCDLPDVERFLSERLGNTTHRQVVGVEVVAPATDDAAEQQASRRAAYSTSFAVRQ